ncbi:hypothetical protein T03_17019, partial [Trichinella britovi]
MDGRICREAACLSASQSIDHLIVNSILPILAASTIFFNSLSVYINATCCYTLLSTLKHTAGGDLKHFLKAQTNSEQYGKLPEEKKTDLRL